MFKKKKKNEETSTFSETFNNMWKHLSMDSNGYRYFVGKAGGRYTHYKALTFMDYGWNGAIVIEGVSVTEEGIIRYGRILVADPSIVEDSQLTFETQYQKQADLQKKALDDIKIGDMYHFVNREGGLTIFCVRDKYFIEMHGYQFPYIFTTGYTDFPNNEICTQAFYFNQFINDDNYRKGSGVEFPEDNHVLSNLINKLKTQPF